MKNKWFMIFAVVWTLVMLMFLICGISELFDAYSRKIDIVLFLIFILVAWPVGLGKMYLLTLKK